MVIGGLHEASGGWTVPLWFLFVLLVPELVLGLEAGRARQVG